MNATVVVGLFTGEAWAYDWFERVLVEGHLDGDREP